MTATTGWFWGTRRSVALKAGGVALVALVSVGGATLGALSAPSIAEGESESVSAQLVAGQGDPGHGVIGFVTGKQADRLTIRTRQGKVASVTIGGDTVVRRGRQRLTLDDIRVGDLIAAIGIPRPKVRPPVMDAKVIIIRPARAIAHDGLPVNRPRPRT